MMRRYLSALTLTMAGLLCSAASAATNLLLNPSFETPIVIGNGNHVGTAPDSWSVNAGGTGAFNLVLGNASDGTAEDGNQYLDLTNGGTFVYQSFTLAVESSVNYGAWFSPRDGSTGSGGNTAIYDSTNATLIDASLRVQNPDSTFVWLESSTTTILPAGTYVFRSTLDDPANTDATFVFATPVPEPAAIGLLSIALLGVVRRRRVGC